MQPFTRHTGIAVPLIKDDINTDQIAPVQSMRNLKPDYQALLFMRARRRDDGSEDPAFQHARLPISVAVEPSTTFGQLVLMEGDEVERHCERVNDRCPRPPAFSQRGDGDEHHEARSDRAE